MAQAFSSEFRKISENTFFHRTPLGTASEIYKFEAPLHFCNLENAIIHNPFDFNSDHHKNFSKF